MVGYFCLIFLIILYKVDFFFENVYFIYFNIFMCLFGFVIYDLDLMYVVIIRNCMIVYIFLEFI